jgi:hypothetical protein
MNGDDYSYVTTTYGPSGPSPPPRTKSDVMDEIKSLKRSNTMGEGRLKMYIVVIDCGDGEWEWLSVEAEDYISDETHYHFQVTGEGENASYEIVAEFPIHRVVMVSLAGAVSDGLELFENGGKCGCCDCDGDESDGG